MISWAKLFNLPKPVLDAPGEVSPTWALHLGAIKQGGQPAPTRFWARNRVRAGLLDHSAINFWSGPD